MPKPPIYILTSEDPLYSVQIIRAINEAFPGQVVGLAFVSGLLTLKRIIWSPFIYGFGRYLLLSLAVVRDGIFGGKIERYCKLQGIVVERFSSVNDGKLLSRIESLGVKLIISVNCNKKLGRELLSAPQYGAINIHNALLPAYRGLMPLVHALANREQQVGVTVHKIDSVFDNGPILGQEAVDILPTDNLFSLWKRCVEVGADLLPKVVAAVIENRAITRKNGPEGASYYSFATPSQILKFRVSMAKRALARTATLWIARNGK